MKKPSFSDILWIKNKNISDRKNHRKIIKKKKNRPISKTRIFNTPEIFCIFDFKNRKDIINIIDNIKMELSKGNNIKIDFSHTIKLHPCGTILFISNINILNKKYPNKISCNYPDNISVEQMLQHVGLLESLGLPPRQIIDDTNVMRWSYYTSTTGTFDSSFTPVYEKLEEHLNQEDSNLLTGVSEAVSNTQDHAYSKDSNNKHWWLFSSIIDDVLHLAVCDLGQGIPISLPKTLYEKLKMPVKSFLRSINKKSDNKDCTMIAAALEYGRSRKNQGHRGKGLTQMLNVANEVDNASFLVYSNKGFYSYQNTNHQINQNDFDDSIHGTVVLWQVPLKVNNNGKNCEN